MCRVTEEDYQLINKLLEDGTIYWDQGEYQFIGKASDGQWVGLGSTKDSVAIYLHYRPSPTQW